MQASIETHEMQLRRCHPRDEPKHTALLNAARKALAALVEYREVIDANPVEPLER